MASWRRAVTFPSAIKALKSCCSLFNFARGSGFNVAIPAPVEYSVKEEKKRDRVSGNQGI